MSSRCKFPFVLPLLASVWVFNNIFWCGMDLIWGSKSASYSRIWISFLLIISNRDNKSPSFFDIIFIIVDTWPQVLLGSLSLPIVVHKRASLKQNAKPLIIKRIGSS